MSACQFSSFRAAVYTLCQPTGDRASRAAAEKFLDSLKYTEEGWETLLAVIHGPNRQLSDSWNNNWTNEERLVAASQLFSASCKGKSFSAQVLTRICPQLATSLRAAHETNDLSTAGYISRTLVALLVRSPELNERELISALFHLVVGGGGGSNGGGSGDVSFQNDILLRLLSYVPEIVTLSSLSMHPLRRQAIIKGLKTELFSSNTSISTKFSFHFSSTSLADLVTSPLQPHNHASETTQEAALHVIQSWCSCLGCLPPVELTENEIRYIHSLAANIGVGLSAGGGGGGEGSEEQQQHETEALAAVLPVLLNCLPELLSAFSATITTASSSKSLSAAVTILGAATAAAASAPQNAIAFEATATFLVQSLLSLLRHPDADTRIATLAIFDTWLSAPTPNMPTSRESNATTTKKRNNNTRKTRGCFPNVEALTALLQQLIACVNLQGLSTSFLTADARDLPEEAHMMRRETTDSIKLVGAALGAHYAASILLQLAENAHRQEDVFQLEACLYVANLLPKNSFLETTAAEAEAEGNGALLVKDHHLVESLLQLGTASITPTAPKLAGTALTLIGGLGSLLGDIYSTASPETSLAAFSESFTQALTTIISTLIQCETSDPKLARNAATTLFRLAGISSIARYISVHLPAAVEALFAWYRSQASFQGVAVAVCNNSHSKYPNDITTSEFVLKSLCFLGARQAQQSLLCEHARQAEDALTGGMISLVTLHLKSVALVLGTAKIGSNEIKEGDTSLEEAGKQLGHLLLNAATATATATMGIAANKEESTGDDIQNLSSSILECSGSLAVLYPGTTEICIQTILILAVKDLVGALHALTTLTSDIQEERPGMEVGQAITHVAVEIAEKVFKSCADSSQNQRSDAAFVALLHFLVAVLHRWPASLLNLSPSLEQVVLASLSAASQSWNRDICESSLALASHVLHNTSIGNLDNGTTTTAWHAVLSFLLAACCGGQPPYMLPSISGVVYSTWMHADNALFLHIFTSAMATPMQLPGGGAAPWAAWTQDMLAKSMNYLFSEASRKDEKQFKRVFKALCGGKKKGINGAPPARQF
ncbi:hypothetical protein Ndes2526A_g05513 [Nannochloris sp. 'desiccata']